MFNDGIRKVVYLFNYGGCIIASYCIDALKILEGRFIFTIKLLDIAETDRALYFFENCSRGKMRPKIKFADKELVFEADKELVFEPEIIQVSRNIFSEKVLVVEIKMPR
jgi:hypothetical protein